MVSENWIIDVKNLQKNFGDFKAVKNIDLQVKAGEIFGFLGPNGSGKTTTLRMLCGLLTPDAGSGTCLGFDIITQSREIKNNIGYIPQHFGLYKQLTVYENLEFITNMYSIKNPRKKILKIIDDLGLAPYKSKLAKNLSGGWKQRLSLAAALIHKPLLLLLDEPTASVDLKSRRDFWEFMYILSREGITILLSSHNMDEVERCDRLCYVNLGRILMTGTIKDIINKVGLITWHVRGTNLSLLAKQLKEIDGIEQVVTFLDKLHVSSTNEADFLKHVGPYMANQNYEWTKMPTTLEDAFVFLSGDTITQGS